MMAWETLRAYMRTEFDLVADEAMALTLAWSFEGDVIQHEWLVHVVARGVSHVAIVCPVVHESALPPRAALVHNTTLAVGALALDGEIYVIREVLPLDALTFPALRRACELVAHEAARLRVNAIAPVAHSESPA